MNTIKTFVLGATGTQGGEVLAELIRRGLPVRAGVGSAASAERLRDQGVESAIVDLNGADQMAKAMAGSRRLYVVLPVTSGVDSNRHLDQILQAAAAAGIEYAVFEPRGFAPLEPTEVGMIELIRGLIAQFLGGPIPGAVVENTVYLDNLLGPWMKPAIVNAGTLTYPFPTDYSGGWVSASSTAKVAASLLQSAKHVGVRIKLHAEGNPTMEQVASALSLAVGREVRFEPMAPSSFAEALVPFMGPEVAHEIGKLYTWHAEHGDRTPRTNESLLQELGVSPESAEDWARRQSWL